MSFQVDGETISINCAFESGRPSGIIKVNGKTGPEVESPWENGVLKSGAASSSAAAASTGSDKKVGVLTLTLLKADLIKDTEWIGKMDPFAKLVSGDQKFKTETCQEAGKSPVWDNATMKFDVKDVNDTVNISIWDEDNGGDDLIGSVDLKFSSLISGSDWWFDIEFEGVKSGAIHIKTDYQDIEK